MIQGVKEYERSYSKNSFIKPPRVYLYRRLLSFFHTEIANP
jgi:hypothetical protein